MKTKIQLSADTTYPFYGVQPDIQAQNVVDEQGQPLDGTVTGHGLSIFWATRPERPEGTLVEDVIWAALQRLQFLNGCSYMDLDHSVAITRLEEALQALKSRRLRVAAEEKQRAKEGG